MIVSVVNPPPNSVSILSANPPARRGTDLILPVLTGQTRWNLGGNEGRKALFVNGVRAALGVDYTIHLPYLDYTGALPLEPSDELLLTY